MESSLGTKPFRLKHSMEQKIAFKIHHHDNTIKSEREWRATYWSEGFESCEDTLVLRRVIERRYPDRRQDYTIGSMIESGGSK